MESQDIYRHKNKVEAVYKPRQQVDMDHLKNMLANFKSIQKENEVEYETLKESMQADNKFKFDSLILRKQAGAVLKRRKRKPILKKKNSHYSSNLLSTTTNEVSTIPDDLGLKNHKHDRLGEKLNASERIQLQPYIHGSELIIPKLKPKRKRQPRKRRTIYVTNTTLSVDKPSEFALQSSSPLPKPSTHMKAINANYVLTTRHKQSSLQSLDNSTTPSTPSLPKPFYGYELGPDHLPYLLHNRSLPTKSNLSFSQALANWANT